MTDNEIIKALECCSDDELCNNCGFVYGDCNCGSYRVNLTQDALSLINRQKAEIERLNEYISRCKSGEEYWVKCLLERPNEAIKEFAERLKATPMRFLVEYVAYYDKPSIDKMVLFIDDNDIDNLVKEMVDDDK